jgi:hypothetical protein
MLIGQKLAMSESFTAAEELAKSSGHWARAFPALGITGGRPAFSPGGPGGGDQVDKGLVGLGAHDFLPTHHEGWDGGNAAGAGIFPVAVDGCLEGSVGQNPSCHLAVKADGPRDLLQDRDVRDVAAVGEIGLEDGQVKLFPFPQGFGPLAEFLGPAAVVGPGAPAPGKLKLGGDSLQPGHGGRQIDTPSLKKLFQTQPLGRGFRMQGEGDPAGLDLILLL